MFWFYFEVRNQWQIILSLSREEESEPWALEATDT